MCNIAGYVGSRPAAPILIEMLKKQEGFAGGYYSGIATLHEGKVYYAKCIGDVERLLKTTNARSLPGTVGIIHSRSKAGGDERWAHPFVSEREGSVQSAYVANGAAGMFASRREEAESVAARLESLGYTFPSRTGETNGYISLTNGDCIHMSDLMAQLIQSHVDMGKNTVAAMNDSFAELPGEIVGLLLQAGSEASITWSRINMPMFLSFADHGAYLASSSLAIPNDAREATLLPCLSGGKVFARSYTVVPYSRRICDMKAIDDSILHSAYDTVQRVLQKGGGCTFSDLYKPLKPLFGVCECNDAEPLCYRILEAFFKEGKLSWENKSENGVSDGLTAPKTYFYLK